jgi:hypothetical protein
MVNKWTIPLRDSARAEAGGPLSGNGSSPHPGRDAGMAVEFRSSGRPEEELDGVTERCGGKP